MDGRAPDPIDPPLHRPSPWPLAGAAPGRGPDLHRPTITVRSAADTAGTCPGPSLLAAAAIARRQRHPDCTRIAFDFTPAFGG